MGRLLIWSREFDRGVAFYYIPNPQLVLYRKNLRPVILDADRKPDVKRGRCRGLSLKTIGVRTRRARLVGFQPALASDVKVVLARASVCTSILMVA